MYGKIAKWIFWVLAIVSIAILVWGSYIGFESDNSIAVDLLLKWAYILMGISIGSVVVLGIGLLAANDPKSLLKIGLGILLIAVITAVAYFTASGDELVAYMGQQPDFQTLKLTDTLLNLTYLLFFASILAIITGEVVSIIRNKQ